jgi:hypothetical protein
MVANTDLKEGILFFFTVYRTRFFILQCIGPIGNNDNEDVYANRSWNMAQKGYNNFIIDKNVNILF